ncbi:GntR family transcriptional regulator [Streptomyces sp. NPDC020719]|uniref:GntR family transcriptional regulator n=1 Tax=Streptomyces sp. NPDC020719 TaxID=3154896 RepID=UPI0033ED12D5
MFTAQFVRRALTTRLRPAACPLTVPVGILSKPAWQQVGDDLRDRIHTGRLRGRLPLRLRSADEYGVSTHTVTKAVQHLADEGLLGIAGGQGTNVRLSADRHSKRVRLPDVAAFAQVTRAATRVSKV